MAYTVDDFMNDTYELIVRDPGLAPPGLRIGAPRCWRTWTWRNVCAD